MNSNSRILAFVLESECCYFWRFSTFVAMSITPCPCETIFIARLNQSQQRFITRLHIIKSWCDIDHCAFVLSLCQFRFTFNYVDSLTDFCPVAGQPKRLKLKLFKYSIFSLISSTFSRLSPNVASVLILVLALQSITQRAPFQLLSYWGFHQFPNSFLKAKPQPFGRTT